MAGFFDLVRLAVLHPSELKAVINHKIWHEPLRRLEDDPEASRINYPSMQVCWKFLDQTSRSFSAVIKELEGDLSRVVCLFYLILRGLDTIEDDMTIDIDLKEDLLRTFHLKLDQPGWKFYGSGPDEKDRKLLVGFDQVIEEFQMLNPSYRSIIIDVTARMGQGMANFARLAANNNSVFSVDTMPNFDLYCHYVAGLVGEGLSKLFSTSGKEDPSIGSQLALGNSMGLLLQKTNILRDFREDVDQGRMFWPKEIWGKYVDHPRDLTDPANLQLAKWALSEMTVDALTHSLDSLEYMTLLKNQSVFNFCAIPQVMAIATLEKCFNNPKVFHENVKIRRSAMMELIKRATNPRDLSFIFADFAQRIHARVDPSDPSFLKLSVLVCKIVAWAENRFPSFVDPVNPPPLYSDAPDAVNFRDVRIRQQPTAFQRLQALAKSQGTSPGAGSASFAQVSKTATKPQLTGDDIKFVVLVVSMVLVIILVTSSILGLVVYFFTKEPGSSIKFQIPMTSLRIEL